LQKQRVPVAATTAPTVAQIAPSQTAIDAITALLGAMNPNQLFDLMSQMKVHFKD
jgi:hypothetical protein